MSASLDGSESRRPVMYRGERIPGLFERVTGEGRLVYELRRKIDGRMVRRTLTATTPTDAIREARSTAAKVEDGMRIVGREDVTLAQLREAFEAWARGRVVPRAEHRRALPAPSRPARFPALGASRKASTVTPAHLRAMIDKLRSGKMSGSSVRGCVVATSALMRYAVRRGLIASNPVRQLERGDRPSGKRTSEPALSRPGRDRQAPRSARRRVPACRRLLRVRGSADLRGAGAPLGRRRPQGRDAERPRHEDRRSAQPVPMTADLVANYRCTAGVSGLTCAGSVRRRSCSRRPPERAPRRVRGR